MLHQTDTQKSSTANLLHTMLAGKSCYTSCSMHCYNVDCRFCIILDDYHVEIRTFGNHTEAHVHVGAALSLSSSTTLSQPIIAVHHVVVCITQCKLAYSPFVASLASKAGQLAALLSKVHP